MYASTTSLLVVYIIVISVVIIIIISKFTNIFGVIFSIDFRLCFLFA